MLNYAAICQKGVLHTYIATYAYTIFRLEFIPLTSCSFHEVTTVSIRVRVQCRQIPIQFQIPRVGASRHKECPLFMSAGAYSGGRLRRVEAGSLSQTVCRNDFLIPTSRLTPILTVQLSYSVGHRLAVTISSCMYLLLKLAYLL